MDSLKQLVIDDDLLLELPIRAHTQALLNVVTDNRHHLHHWRSWIGNILSLKEMQAYIDMNTRDFHAIDQGMPRHAGYNYLIVYQQRIVGMVGFQGINFRNKITALGYWISSEEEGKGIVKKSVHRLMHAAFNDLRLNRIEVQCAVNNVRSQMIPERLGFVKEAVLAEVEYDEMGNRFLDHILYRMLKRDFTG